MSLGKNINSKVGNFSGRSLQVTALTVALAGLCIALAGCGDFFAEKPTELESRNILRDLSEVRPIPDIDNPVPEEYKQPPEIIEGIIGEDTDAKLFYFTKYHTPDKLAKMIDEQFLKSFRDSKGKEYPQADYQVTSNEATNQLVVRCPTVADAQQVLEFLEATDVPPIQVKIDCLISEVYADHTMDWETTLQIENLFGAGVALGGKETANGDVLPAFPGAALRDVARSTFGLKAGIDYQPDEPGHRFRALVDLLASRGYLKILMNPQLEVLNGETASIVASEQVPLDEISNVNPNSDIITKSTRYYDVIDSLEITPQVFADGYIGLRTRAVIGSKSTPEGVKQIPIVTKREVQVQENRIRQGESLIIGGIKKTEKRSVVRGVPFLKDIPVIGVLFSSKDFEERGKEVLFILTPSISSGGIPNEEMVQKLKDKHESVKRDSLVDMVTDPFGNREYTALVEEEASQTQVAKTKAEMERSQAQRRASWLARELRRTNEQLQLERRRAAEAAEKAEAARQAYEKAHLDAAEKLKEEKNRGSEIEGKLQQLQKQVEQARKQAAQTQQKAAEAKQQMEQTAKKLTNLQAELASETGQPKQSPAESKQQGDQDKPAENAGAQADKAGQEQQPEQNS